MNRLPNHWRVLFMTLFNFFIVLCVLLGFIIAVPFLILGSISSACDFIVERLDKFIDKLIALSDSLDGP